MLRAPLPFPRLGSKNLSLHVLWFLARPTLPFFLPFALRLRRRVGKLAHALPGGLILGLGPFGMSLVSLLLPEGTLAMHLIKVLALP